MNIRLPNGRPLAIGSGNPSKIRNKKDQLTEIDSNREDLPRTKDVAQGSSGLESSPAIAKVELEELMRLLLETKPVAVEVLSKANEKLTNSLKDQLGSIEALKAEVASLQLKYDTLEKQTDPLVQLWFGRRLFGIVTGLLLTTIGALILFIYFEHKGISDERLNAVEQEMHSH